MLPWIAWDKDTNDCSSFFFETDKNFLHITKDAYAIVTKMDKKQKKVKIILVISSVMQ